MNLTLEQIKSDQAKLAEMIAAFETQAKRHIIIPATEIELQAGEHYAGIILGKDGVSSHHLILLGDEPTDELNWQAAKDWAKRVGGELPTRREQALLYANLKDQFKAEWYWSCEQHASIADYAWMQYFYSGTQDDDHKLDEYRARAVRRLVIQ